MQRLIRTRFLSLLIPAMACSFLAAPVHAAISGQESSSSALSGIDDSTYTYDSTIATNNVNTYTQQYEDTITQIAITDADIATIQAHINTQGATDDESRALKFRSAYFKLVDKAADLRNKARALDTLISSQKLNDSSSNGQVLSDADYNILKARLEAAEAQAKANRTELETMEDRLNSGDPTASLNQYDYLYKESVRLSDMAHSLREILNNSVYPDGTPSVATNPTSSSGSSSSGSGSGSGNSTMDTIKGAVLQGVLGSLGGGSSGMNLGSFGGIQNAISGMNVGGAQVGNIKPDTSAVVSKPQAPVKQTASKDKSCKDAAADAATKAKTDALPERDDSGKITKAAPTGTTETSPGKAADDAVMGSTKPDCVGVDYTKKNPGGTDGSTDAEELAKINAMKGQFNCDPSNSNCSVNNQQCASLTKAYDPSVGPASTWRKGELVKGADIPVGTPIATFNYGDSYCTVVNGTCGVPGGGITHTCIFMSQDSEGINCMSQSSGHPAQKVQLKFDSGSKISGNYYYTIKGNSKTGLLDTIPLLQPVWIALGLVPLDGGLQLETSANSPIL